MLTTKSVRADLLPQESGPVDGSIKAVQAPAPPAAEEAPQPVAPPPSQGNAAAKSRNTRARRLSYVQPEGAGGGADAAAPSLAEQASPSTASSMPVAGSPAVAGGAAWLSLACLTCLNRHSSWVVCPASKTAPGGPSPEAVCRLPSASCFETTVLSHSRRHRQRLMSSLPRVALREAPLRRLTPRRRPTRALGDFLM